MLWYLLEWTLYFTLWGISIYFVDRMVWVRAKKWLYDIWHEEPIPLTAVKGVMLGRSSKRQVIVAGFISGLQGLVMWYRGEDFLVEFLLWWIEAIIFMIGFRIGARLFPLFHRQDEFFDKLDEVSAKAGQLDFGVIRKDMSDKVEGSVRSFVTRIPRLFRAYVFDPQPAATSVSPKPASNVSESPAPASAPQEPQPSSQEILERFTRKRS